MVSSLLITLVLALGGGLLFLVNTEDGLELAFQVAQTLLPSELSITQVKGQLVGPLELRQLAYRDETLDIKVARIRLEWNPRMLFRGRVSLRLLEIEGLDITTSGQSESDSSGAVELPAIDLPFNLEVQVARVLGGRLTVASSATTVEIHVLELGGALTGSALALDVLRLETPDAAAHAQGRITLADDFPVNLALDWTFRGVPGEPVEGRGELAGNRHALALRQVLSGGVRAQLTAEVDSPLEYPAVTAGVQLEFLNPALLDPTWPLLDLSGDLSLTGGPDALALSGLVAVSGEQFGQLTSHYQLAWENGSLAVQRLEVAGDNGLALRASGHWTPGREQRFALQGDWSEIGWPLIGAAEWRSPSGHFEVSGTPADYRFRITGSAMGAQIPDASLVLAGRGGFEQALLEQIQIDTLEGLAKGEGKFSWQPSLAWELGIRLENINPGTYWSGWAGKLGGQVASGGALSADGPEGYLRIPSVSGSLRGYPVNLEADLNLQSGGVQINGMNLRSGSSRMELKGTLTEHWDLTWQVQSSNLETLLPELGGRVSASGVLTGRRDQPGIKAKMSGGQLSYQRYRIGDLGGDIDFRSGGGENIQLRLGAKDVDLGQGESWTSIRLDGTGALSNHRLSLVADGGPAAVNLLLVGGLDSDNLWQGSLTTLELNQKDAGRWRLLAPVSLKVGPDRINVSRGCLGEDGGRICLALDGGNGVFDGEAKLEHIALQRLKPWVMPGIELTGMLEGSARVKRDAEGTLLTDVNLTTPQGAANFTLATSTQTLDFSGSRVQMKTDHTGLAAKLKIPVNQNGGIEGSLQLPGWSLQGATNPEQVLDGRLKARMDDLGLFAGLVQGVAELQGRLNMDLSLGGTYARPAIRGHAWLKDGSLLYAPLAVRLEHVELEAVNRGVEELVYRGGLTAGEGDLKIEGSTQLDSSRGVSTKFSLRGENLTVSNIPEAWVLLSPDLHVSYDSRLLQVTGELVIPRARIRPRALPETAVTASPDIRYLGDSEDQAASPPVAVIASVRVRMGDQVSFNGFGVRGLIRGNLLVNDEPGKPTLGSGQLAIESGTYKAYGQELEIRQGRAIFANSLVTNPGIAVTAVRTINDTEVGVNVSGTLKKPRLRVFSTPAMTQSEALSYLIFGRPLGRTASDADRERMQSAAAGALVAGGGGILAAEIGRQFGLDELDVQSSGENNELALHLGAYLSPRLYIQYISELSTAKNQVKMRYDLTEKIQLQTETGTVHGADIFYTIER